MRRLLLIVCGVLLLAMSITAVASAGGDPVAGCPDNFALHPAMPHDDHHGHLHAGTETDLNGDGWICVKHVSVDGSIHVHIDNDTLIP